MSGRVEKLLSSLEPMGAGAMLLHSTENIRYFSGFTGEGYAVIAKDVRAILTDSRYTEQAQNQAPGFLVKELPLDKFADAVRDTVREHGVTCVGFEDELLPVSQHSRFAETLCGITLVPVGSLCVKLRSVKDAAEIELLRKACNITDKAYQYALLIARPGITEIELCTELKYYMAKVHKALPSFDFIVAAGENGSMPHAIPSDRVIKNGDMVTLDFGAQYMGYRADMTRTFAVGKPNARMKKIYDIVLRAQTMAAETLGPGVACKTVDAVARDYIAGKGFGPNFGHGLGHGVGLQVHELPGLNGRNELALAPGMAVTVEPGIYLPGVGGVRIEDTCVITENGWESLFISDKNLIIL